MSATNSATLVPASFLSCASCLLPERPRRTGTLPFGGRWHALPGIGDGSAGGLRRPLTPAEQRVFDLVLAGLADKEIARVLGRAVPTVKHQVSAILQKHRVPSRARLMAVMRESGGARTNTETIFFGRTGG